MPKIFPDSTVVNRVISVTGRGATKEFSALMADTIPDLEMISKGQCFPLSTYEGENVVTEPSSSRAEPSRAEPSRAEPSRAEPSRLYLKRAA